MTKMAVSSIPTIGNNTLCQMSYTDRQQQRKPEFRLCAFVFSTLFPVPPGKSAPMKTTAAAQLQFTKAIVNGIGQFVDFLFSGRCLFLRRKQITLHRFRR